jgi:hypothetical protein
MTDGIFILSALRRASFAQSFIFLFKVVCSMIRIFAEIAPAGEVTSAYQDYYLFAIIKIKNAFYEFFW